MSETQLPAPDPLLEALRQVETIAHGAIETNSKDVDDWRDDMQAVRSRVVGALSASPQVLDEGTMQVRGKLFDIGLLDTGERGIRVESNGETVTLTGLSMAELKALAPSLGEPVCISVCALKGRGTP